MIGFQKKKLVLVSVVYWFLLSYMLAALLWWFIALEKQNRLIANIRLGEFKKDDISYILKVAEVESAAKRKTIQYIGEGLTFLGLIMFGAVFVFRATRRQIRLSHQQQNFMMAVTHELKTPIAVTQLNLETLQKRQLDDGTKQKLIVNTLQEANRLNTLCNNILFASQLDAGIYSKHLQEINFTDLIHGCIDDFRIRFPQRIFEEKINEHIYLHGEPLLLQLLANNLIDNALKYAPKEQPILLSLSEIENHIHFSVIDQGQGVPDVEKKNIFDKFYRIGNENTRQAKGTGLGLYLCKKIAQSHKANISMTDNNPQGSNFTVIFKHA
ncbi:MAG: ATP-binding protein [Bacteroidetes bacterium]|nr:ATP-binding protein [Bacteroidota bacterium]